MGFKVGDRVKIIDVSGFQYICNGDLGYVKNISDEGIITVRIDKTKTFYQFEPAGIEHIDSDDIITKDTVTDDTSGNLTHDTVNHPSHYTDGKIEVINFIEDKGLNFNKGNAVKYIARAGKKDPSKEIEDLKKAQWYINREIKRLEVLEK